MVTTAIILGAIFLSLYFTSNVADSANVNWTKYNGGSVRNVGAAALPGVSSIMCFHTARRHSRLGINDFIHRCVVCSSVCVCVCVCVCV